MKVTNLKVGKTYYLPIKGCPTNYTSGVLVKILEENKVLMQGKKGIFKCNARKLHESPDKAVKGMKSKVRVRQEMNNMNKEERKLYDSLRKKVKNLGWATYLTFDKNAQYIVQGYCGKISFSTLEELKEWINSESIELKEIRSNLNNCKFLQVGKRFYKILSISYNRCLIKIQKNEYTEEIHMSVVVKKEDLKNRYKIISK